MAARLSFGPDRGPDRRLRAVVHGLVHGVGFRDFVFRRARAMGLRGWVRNRPDGTVECVAEGEMRQLERLVEELRVGPRLARVTRVEVDWEPARGDLDAFELIW